ncbi:MAG TPA: hypothetical protein VGM78_14280, partial [Ilumatobacteraceae bacterium]
IGAYRIAQLVTESHDSQGITTPSAWFPGKAELIYGSLSSVVIFALLYKFAGPMAKKAFAARTERIQKELDSAATDKASAQAEATGIRAAKGDIAAEESRIMADAATQAEALLADGRTRLDAEIAEMRTRAAADIETANSRGFDELRGEITRLSSSAADRAVSESIDDATHQQLIESFIQKVGASS